MLEIPPTSSSLSVSSSFVIPEQIILSTAPLHTLIFTTVSSMLQHTIPIPTPLIITTAPTVTTTILDLLPAIVQRLSDLEKQFEAWKQVDHSKVIEELVQANIINEVKNQLPKFLPKVVSDVINPRIESIVCHNEAIARGEANPDKVLRKRDRGDDQDEDPSTGPNQGKKTKRRRTKESESSKKSSTIKETSKGNTPPKASKTDKYVHTEESVAEPTKEVTMDAEENPTNDDVVNDTNQPQEQTWFNDLVSSEKGPLTFDELMATPIDFSKFVMNRLKLDKITKANLVGPVYKLLKGTYRSSIELEYNLEECYKALSDRLD
ncbi:hypothetical protein Tco_1386050 [Tanacetum coccineum]